MQRKTTHDKGVILRSPTRSRTPRMTGGHAAVVRAGVLCAVRLPGVGLTVVLSRHNVFEQFASSNPVEEKEVRRPWTCTRFTWNFTFRLFEKLSEMKCFGTWRTTVSCGQSTGPISPAQCVSLCRQVPRAQTSLPRNCTQRFICRKQFLRKSPF